MSFAVIIELAAIVALAVVLLGGVQQRDKGWRVFVPLVGGAAGVQCAGMAIVVSRMIDMCGRILMNAGIFV
jgi:hypothetical protein